MPGTHNGMQRTALCLPTDYCYTNALAKYQRKKMKFTAVFQKVPEGYIGFVEELPGANTQGATLDETKKNLREAVSLVLEANRTLAEESIQDQEVMKETLDIAAL